MMNQSDHILPKGPSALPLLPGLRNRNLILASASPRRKQLLSLLGIPFEVRPIGVDEVYPDDLIGPAIPRFLSELKASDVFSQHRVRRISAEILEGEAAALGEARARLAKHGRQERRVRRQPG